MNLETKIIIYKFTPQVFTLTHFVSIGCNGKQIGVFGLHCRQDLFAIPGEKIINPTD